MHGQGVVGMWRGVGSATVVGGGTGGSVLSTRLGWVGPGKSVHGEQDVEVQSCHSEYERDQRQLQRCWDEASCELIWRNLDEVQVQE